MSLEELLDRVPGWAGRPRSVEPLEGGITNRNYRVTLDDGTYVLRAPGEHTDLLGIDRDHELEAARQAAALGVGPEVVAFVDPGSLVTRFLPGATATAETLRTSPELEQVAELLRTVHAGPPIKAVFDWWEVLTSYAATATAHGVDLPPACTEVLRVASRIRAACARPAEQRCPCHNDLLAANFLVTDDGLRLVDWEYAGMNDRWFDLGNFAVNNELDADAEHALVEAYLGVAAPGSLARLRLMKVISDAREGLWGMVQAGVSSLDVDFVAYGTDHLERARVAAARPGFDGLLAEAADA